MALSLRVVGGLSAQLVCALEAKQSWTVRLLKCEIEALEGTPWEIQRLVLNGEVLRDSETLGRVLPEGAAEVQLVRGNPERQAALRGIQEGRVELEDVDEEWQADREIVLAAVKLDGHAILYAAPEMRLDREIVLAAVTESGLALRHMNADMCKDRDIVLTAVKQHGDALQFASESLRADAGVVLEAVKAPRGSPDMSAIQYASDLLLDDLTFMTSAVRVTGATIRHASDRLKQDRDLVLSAVRDYAEALFSAGPLLQHDAEFVKELVDINGCAIAYAAQDVREDPRILARALKNTPESLSFLRRMTPAYRNKLITLAHAELNCPPYMPE